MQYYKKTSHTVYDCTYIVWVTKYRYNILLAILVEESKLENDHLIIAHTSGRMRKNRIRILLGDTVRYKNLNDIP
ncbi:MAG: hypothetical protein O7C60_04275 [Rickettsia endosymbiont of Ixodes persulcatus]|nr:hypothetical protein [Rickettsia endosymbiont of Ixodes persulcatus]